ncbi:MAG: hypothetical protein GY866_35770 [Proteobacteria bacterium]|nr:hypothetical protein [Pseudomonadota bacterium]
MTTLQNSLLEAIDWFIPNTVQENFEHKRRAQLIVALALAIVPFHIGPIVKFLSLGSSLVYLNFGHTIIVLVMLFVFKRTGSIVPTGNIVLLTLFAQMAASAYFTGGLNANILGLLLVIPILGILVVGYAYGLLYLVLLATLLIGFYGLEIRGYEFPVYSLSPEKLLSEKYYYLCAVLAGFTFMMMVFQVVKNNSLQAHKEEEERNRALSHKLQNIINKTGMDASNLASAAEELSAASEQMQRNSEEISASEIQTSTSINQSTNTIQELSASFRETSKRMRDLEELANSAEEEGNFGAEIVHKAYKTMNQVEKSIGEIGGVNQVIAEIAEQTNLLSLNAAIEADKAGEYGKGLAVVAEEVGSLAVRSNEAALRISDLIEKTSENIIAEKNVIDETGKVLEDIIRQVGKITGQIHFMTVAVKEQDFGTREIAKAAEEISHVAEKNVELVAKLAESITESNNAINDLSRIADQLDDQLSLHKT